MCYAFCNIIVIYSHCTKHIQLYQKSTFLLCHVCDYYNYCHSTKHHKLETLCIFLFGTFNSTIQSSYNKDGAEIRTEFIP